MSGRAVLSVVAALAFLAPMASRAQEDQGEGDPYVLAVMNDFNETLRAEWMDLRAEWMDLRVEQIELLTVGHGRASSRIHLQPYQWVPADPRRAADGTNLTYLVDLADGFGKSGLTAATAEGAVDRAMATWAAASCLEKLQVIKRAGDGSDPDIFDSRFGYGGFGDYRAADVVHAGWLPPDFFDQVTGPGGGESVVALSVTFIYVGRDGEPTDLDGNGYLDTAHSEIYYNQGFSWAAGAPDGVLDVESVALHELGHSLGIGHLGPPPEAVMNPTYVGTRTDLQPFDHAALCSVWGAWPN